MTLSMLLIFIIKMPNFPLVTENCGKNIWTNLPGQTDIFLLKTVNR